MLIFLFGFCAFLFVFDTEAANSLSYCGEPKTWIEAKIFCEMKGGRLMNRGTENDALFLQRPDIPEYQEVWLGQYKGLSGWVEEIGCFSEQSLGVSWYSIQQPDNSASICQSICNGTDYFAMKGSTCLCSYNNFVNISYFTPKSNCILKCPGNRTENCGGTGSMTVYHRVHGDLIKYDPDSYPHLQCAIMNCSSSSDWTYHEHDCSDNLTALCGTGVLVNQPATWLTAQSFCKDYKSLIGLHNMVPSCAINDNEVKRQFWIGLSRNQVKLDLKDRFVQNPVIGCYAIIKQPSTPKPISQFYSIDVCEKHNKFPFICELPPGKPTDNGCSLPSTTSTTTLLPISQPLEPDDEGLKIGLYVALGVVILAAIIVVLLLLTRRKKSNPDIPRRLYLLQALSNIKRRRNREESNPHSSTPQSTEKGTVNEGFTDSQFEDRKPEYAVVSKPGRRQSAPEPCYKVYNKPVTVLDKSPVSPPSPNNGYDSLHTDSMKHKDPAIPVNSILKSSDKMATDRYLPRQVRIQDEGYSRHNTHNRQNGHTLSTPRKVIPVPPPVVNYPPPEHHGASYEQIGTTLL